ncbi:hypothetical protein GCM10009603_54630 [Nocardiopsis exhalans]
MDTLRHCPCPCGCGVSRRILASVSAAPNRTSSGRLDVRSLALPALSSAEQAAQRAAAHRLTRLEGLLGEIAELGRRLAQVGHHGLREGDLRPQGLRNRGVGRG